jgi:hypothetical protein
MDSDPNANNGKSTNRGLSIGRGNEVSAMLATPPGRLTRSQAARRLGVSVTTLRRMEGGVLHPEKGPGDVRLFDVSEVEAAFLRIRSSRPGITVADGEVAAEVFGLLDDGLNPVDVVKRTHVAPDIVEQLQVQWARMRRALLLSPEARERVEVALLGVGASSADGWVFKTAADLEVAIADAATPTGCARCGKNSASLCRGCAKEYGLRTSAEAG